MQNRSNRQSINLKELYSQIDIKKIIKKATKSAPSRVERQDSIGSSNSDFFSASMPILTIDSRIINIEEKVINI